MTARTAGCEERLKLGYILGASASLPDLRPRRLLRQLAGPPRHEAFHTSTGAPGDGLLRARANDGPGAAVDQMQLDVPAHRRAVLVR